VFICQVAPLLAVAGTVIACLPNVHRLFRVCEKIARGGKSMTSQSDSVNPISEHNLYLTLYVSSAGGV